MSSMGDVAAFHDEVRRRLAAQPALVVASIVRHRGSTPRKTGAKMLIDPSGAHLGTVGGGCGEAEVMSRAHRVLGTGAAQLVEVSLLEDEGWDSQALCGGVLDVFIERLGAQVGGVERDVFFAALDRASEGGRAVAVISVIEAAEGEASAPLVGRKTLVDERGVQHLAIGVAELDEAIVDQALEALGESRPRSAELELASGKVRIYVELVCDPPELVVVGAGHVGAAVARIGSHAGFSITVVDDRASFANPARLPEAHHIVLDHPPAALAALPARRDRHVVVVTRGHRLDAECLRVGLGMELAYLGMIGSRRRVRRIFEQLAGEGFAPEALARVHAPIGFDIGAETPAEIAVAILAEVIDARRRGRSSGASLSRRERVDRPR
jgi:xanthine dehydrogenase accessory factor